MRLKSGMLLIVVFLMSISACSNKSIYQGIQANRQAECNKEPNENARAECLGQTSPSFETYERDRKTLIKRNER